MLKPGANKVKSLSFNRIILFIRHKGQDTNIERFLKIIGRFSDQNNWSRFFFNIRINNVTIWTLIALLTFLQFLNGNEKSNAPLRMDWILHLIPFYLTGDFSLCPPLVSNPPPPLQVIITQSLIQDMENGTLQWLTSNRHVLDSLTILALVSGKRG